MSWEGLEEDQVQEMRREEDMEEDKVSDMKP